MSPKKRGNKEPRPKNEAQERRFFRLLRQGTQALQQGDIAKAMRFLERSHQLDPKNVDAALNLGGAYILAKKFTKAVSVLEPLSQRDPHNPMVWTNLGAAYLGNPVLAGDENQQRAIVAFKQALELNPTTPNVAYNLGLIYKDRREKENALYWFERAMQANPNDQDAKHYVKQLTQEIENDK